MSEGIPFTDAFASATGAQSMRDVLSRRCAELSEENAKLRKEVGAVRRRLAEITAAYKQASEHFGVPSFLADVIKRPAP